MIRENVESIRDELWGAWWYCRCTLAGDFARVAILLGNRAHRRISSGQSAPFSRRSAFLFRWLAVRFFPPILRVLVGEK